MERPRTLAFVCEHGALKSRLAAAYFNLAAPTRWRAVSAGVHPQENVSVHAARLLAGTAAATLLDTGPPRPVPLDDVADVVAIDCEFPGARVWRLAAEEPCDAMRAEILALVEELIVDLGERRLT